MCHAHKSEPFLLEHLPFCAWAQCSQAGQLEASSDPGHWTTRHGKMMTCSQNRKDILSFRQLRAVHVFLMQIATGSYHGGDEWLPWWGWVVTMVGVSGYHGGGEWLPFEGQNLKGGLLFCFGSLKRYWSDSLSNPLAAQQTACTQQCVRACYCHQHLPPLSLVVWPFAQQIFINVESQTSSNQCSHRLSPRQLVLPLFEAIDAPSVTVWGS